MNANDFTVELDLTNEMWQYFLNNDKYNHNKQILEEFEEKLEYQINSILQPKFPEHEIA